MENKMTLRWNDVDNYVGEIVRQINISGWRPTRVVGVARGGLVAATQISHYFGVPLTALHVCLRDNKGVEKNLSLAEAAVGFCDNRFSADSDPSLREDILIVDDICDTGATQAWIKEDWQASCLPQDPAWDDVWNKNVRFAALVHNLGSGIDLDYTGKIIDKREKDVWVEFPWEIWWRQ